MAGPVPPGKSGFGKVVHRGSSCRLAISLAGKDGWEAWTRTRIIRSRVRSAQSCTSAQAAENIAYAFAFIKFPSKSTSWFVWLLWARIAQNGQSTGKVQTPPDRLLPKRLLGERPTPHDCSDVAPRLTAKKSISPSLAGAGAN